MKPDLVNHPPHYADHPSSKECISYSQSMSFCLGNAFKYLWRAGRKTTEPLEDLRKAKWYLERELSLYILGHPGLPDELHVSRAEQDEVVRWYSLPVREALKGIFLVAEGGLTPTGVREVLRTALYHVEAEIQYWGEE